MSSVKIQIVQNYTPAPETEVRVDNKFAYTTLLSPNEETVHIQKLIKLLQLDNVEVSHRKRV